MTNPQRSAAGESGAGKSTNSLNNSINIRLSTVFDGLINKHFPNCKESDIKFELTKGYFTNGTFDGDVNDLNSDIDIAAAREAGITVEVDAEVDSSPASEYTSEVIRYSSGVDKFDNTPKQLEAQNFDEFRDAVLATHSPQKGKTYFCSALAYGYHNDTNKYPDEGNYRLAKNVEPRRFLPIDFDGFRNPTAFTDGFKYLDSYKGFGYTTWSHTALAPRARAVLELDREVSRDEEVLVGEAFEAQMKTALGSDFATFDPCIYRGEQPVYGAPPNANIFKFDGKVLEVDQLLACLVPQEPKPNKQSTIEDTTASLASSFKSDPETPENIARVKSALSAIDPDCDRALWRDICFAIHSLGWSCSEQLARSWSKGELQ